MTRQNHMQWMILRTGRCTTHYDSRGRYQRNVKRHSTHHSQRGVVMGEYLIGTLLVAMALFAPVPVLGESAFAFLVDALRGFQAHTTYLMSMP